MSCNWSIKKLGDLVKFTSGGTPSKSNEAYWGGDIPWISASSMNSTRYSESELKVTTEGAKNGTRLVPKDTVLLLVRGGALHNKIPVGITTREVTFNQDVKALVPKTDEITPWYLLFWLISIKKTLLAKVENTGIGAGKLDTKILQELEVPLPPKPELKRLEKFCKALDNKIILNADTNQTLEQMAQAIFKSWFVDFDPVKAKMNGELPEGMDADTASLFPEKLVESELGLIPEGWDILPLSSYINIKHGFAFKGEYFSDQETGDICVTPGNFHIGGGIKLDKLKYYDGPIPEDYIFSKGDLMVTMTDLSKQADTLGYPAFVPESEGKTYLHNQRIGKVELKIEQDIKNYLYSFFCSSGYRNEVLSGVTGSTVKHTAPKKIMAIEVALDPRVADKFSQLVAPLFEKKAQNLAENSYLEKLRDTLLPKLLSGEIDLSEVEERTEVS
ncbi:restriction endonuclease subunit S [Vibrio parahaemolyticus]|uniref:restriction endonuclease subunit S n=1 Tax=Vibrio parahaemolyticus TaxID=670 RepID=UPI001124753F|nr:restriction endonuclease subunit S [Vibrio parahaemolyticus]MCZ6385259.1 restriction endonuclease subunit S [Vibrio parahaemolyticus]MDF4862355.1 restriction endonuclease subunit S [Vibrio parahaemolyticus]MRD97072.1 restriction endonuclease subunit S [Vibrio parahaemolyticus]QNE56896.1 restriction endonuclease subunit S [Vibrio parahaemolyticus]TNZ06912.1 restriction endonuclease subunit S [Vibrio parahaemolyticus]